MLRVDLQAASIDLSREGNALCFRRRDWPPRLAHPRLSPAPATRAALLTRLRGTSVEWGWGHERRLEIAEGESIDSRTATNSRPIPAEASAMRNVPAEKKGNSNG